MGFTLELPHSILLRLQLIERLVALVEGLGSLNPMQKIAYMGIEHHFVQINIELEKFITENV